MKPWVWWHVPVVLAVVKWIRRSRSYLAMQDVRDSVSHKTHKPLSIVKVVGYQQPQEVQRKHARKPVFLRAFSLHTYRCTDTMALSSVKSQTRYCCCGPVLDEPV